MDGNWKLLADYAARRRAELGLSQVEAAQRGPLSLDRLQSIEGAKRTSYRLGTLLALERALGWAEGSVERILAGGEPRAAHEGSVRSAAPGSGKTEAYLANLVAPTDEELRRSGLKPETAEAIIRMRERIARAAAEGDETLIRRMDRVTEALDEDRDAG